MPLIAEIGPGVLHVERPARAGIFRLGPCLRAIDPVGAGVTVIKNGAPERTEG